MWGRDGALWRHRRIVLCLWGLVLLGSLPLAARQSSKLSGGGFTDTRSPSAQVERALERHEFHGVHAATLATVLVPRTGARAADLRAATASVERAVSRVRGLTVDEPARRAALASALRRPTRPIVIPLDFAGGERASIDFARQLRPKLSIEGSRAGRAADGRVDLHIAGQGGFWAGFQSTADAGTKAAEARGFPVIAIVLLLAFGSLAAAALPLSLGVAAVVVTGAVIYLLSLGLEMSIFVTSVASMIGIGVAVDYSLFILVRYREEVRAGHDRDTARATAMSTSGRAVVFSGLTVITSLAALFLIPSSGLRSMAAGAMIVVAFAVLAASTLLPVSIALLGGRAIEPGRLGRLLARRRRRAEPAAGHSFWARWTRAVMRRPAVSVVAGTAVMLTLAAPALSLTARNDATSQLPIKHETRQGLLAAAHVLGPGALGPAYVVVRFNRGTMADPSARGALRRVSAVLARDPITARLAGPRGSADGRAALLTATFRTGQESQAARDAVERFRRRLLAVVPQTATVAVGGTTAVLVDFDRLVTRSLWKLMLFVLAVSFVVLLVLLRSVVLPLKAVLMNLLSIGAAYGVVVAVFQWGWLEFLGIHKTGNVYSIVLPLVLVVAFGLSMDYHVFLLSRIRERYAATGDNRRAVAEALETSATPITSAALIMVAVFLAFVSASVPSVKQIGLANAVAIGVDATLVRLVIVPAAMELLGKWNWWLPEPLARILPRRSPPTAGASRPAPVSLQAPAAR